MANHFLTPAFVQTLVQELAVDTFFWPIMRQSTADSVASSIPAAPLAARRDDWGGLDSRAANEGGEFNMIQNHVHLLFGKVHAVPTHATATAADAAEIIYNMCLRSGDGYPDVLVVDHNQKFTCQVFQAFVKSMG